MTPSITARFVSLTLLFAALAGCGYGGPVNPSFPLAVDDAKAALEEMEDRPVRLERPVVVLGGWGDPLGIPPARLAKRLREVTGDDRVLAVGMGWISSFDACRDRVLRHVEERWPSEDPEWTTEVDVIGFSMGGLVAQDAARPADPPPPPPEASRNGDEQVEARKRLNIRRLFCLSVPIQGADWAELPTIDPLSKGMRRDSDFQKALAAARDSAKFEDYYYVRLDDEIVGEWNAAPPGETAWWVPNRALQQAHGHAYKDPRILADFARRLRGEPPYTTEPPAPLPEKK